MDLVELKRGAMLILTLSPMTACLSVFMQECFKSGMIFSRYHSYLTALWIKSWRKADRWKRFWLKPAGLCIYCNGTWIFICTYLMLVNSKNAFIPTIIVLFLGIGLNFIWIKILEKL